MKNRGGRYYRSIGTVAAAVIAAGALIFGLVSFRQSTEAQQDDAATARLQDYLELKAANVNSNNEDPAPYLSDDGEGSWDVEDATELNPKYGWTALHALFTAEQIYYSRGTADPTWAETAGEIAYEHRWFIMDQPWEDSGWFNCDYYGDEFIMLMENTLKEHGEVEFDVCSPKG